VAETASGFAGQPAEAALSLAGGARAHSWALIGIVSFALFMDYLVYGATMPLMAFAPGGTMGEEQLGGLATAYALGTLLATPLFGWLGVRRGCREVMIGGVALAGLATLLFVLAPDFSVLFAARLAQGAAGAALWIAGLALIAERYSGRRVEMMGYALVGGWLYDAGGYQLPFIVLLALSVVEAALCLWLLPGKLAAPAADAHDKTPGRIVALLLDKSVLVPAVAVALAAAGWGILEPLLPLHLLRGGETGAANIGILFAVATIVYGVAAPCVSWLCGRIGVRAVIVGGMVGMGLSLPLLSLSDNFWFLLIVLCLIGVFFGMLINPTSAELGDAVERRGLTCYPVVYSVYNIAYAVGMMGTSSFAAAIAARIGFFFTLLLVSVALLACAPPMLAATRVRGDS
jgi:MFS family permease